MIAAIGPSAAELAAASAPSDADVVTLDTARRLIARGDARVADRRALEWAAPATVAAWNAEERTSGCSSRHLDPSRS